MSKFIRVSALSVNLNVVMWIIAVIATTIVVAKGSNPTGLLPILFGGVAVSLYVVSSKQREDGGTDT